MMSIPPKSRFWRRYADKVGISGSVFAALCCLGFPALLLLLGAISLGFLINDAILLPLLAIFLVIILGGLYAGRRHYAFGLGSLSAVVLFVFLFINPAIAYIGLIGIIVASGLNIYHTRTHCQQC